MIFRKNKKKFIIYPEDKSKHGWDLLMTAVLFITCIQTPLDIAFSKETPDSIFQNPVSFAIDMMFLLDIIIIFNTAYYTEDMDIQENRKDIGIKYLTGWFFIDFLAIVPFDVILNTTQNFNSLSRVARIGRLYKLVKLTRLLRVLKIIKDKNKLVKYLTDWLKIGLGFERLFFFIIIFILGMHLSACFWLITASFTADEKDEEYTGTWLNNFAEKEITDSGLYAVAFYWSV